MTRDELRARCIEAMEIAYEQGCDMAAAFDALHGIAMVLDISEYDSPCSDLTNPPEKK